jgi:DNA-binding CsgD family transcriptional regulator
MADEQPATSREVQETARVLAAGRTYIETLPATERAIAEMAANGAPVWEIAQSRQMSEAAVARTIDGVVAAVTGRPIHPVETGGLGADTDPGVTGGYGDTGFGALDTEPIPDNTEPIADVAPGADGR